MSKYESPTHQRPAEAGTNHKNPPNVTPKKIGTTMAQAPSKKLSLGTGYCIENFLNQCC